MRRFYLLAFLALLLPLRLTAATAESFLWDQANASLARASTPEDFLASARLYRTLLDRDAARPAVLQNYGTALLLAERPAEALDAYLRAERLAGTSPALLHDLHAATAALAAGQAGPAPAGTAPAPSLPWYRSVLPWHYALPLRVRVAAALAAWTVFWVALPFRRRRLPRALLVLAALALVLFASSSALSLHANAAPLPPLP